MKQKPISTVQSFYDQAGEKFSSTRKWLWPEMLPYLNILQANDTVLDIGCGNGRLLNGMREDVSYTGVDFSAVLLSHARRLHPQKTFLQGNILHESTWESLPVARAVFCVAVAHHIEQKQLPFFFKQLAAHVQKGGFVYLSSWNLWQRKYLPFHISPKNLAVKLAQRDFRAVWIPFNTKYDRYCLAHSHTDFTRAASLAGLTLEKAFFSGGTSYLSGRNIVQIYHR